MRIFYIIFLMFFVTVNESSCDGRKAVTQCNEWATEVCVVGVDKMCRQIEKPSLTCNIYAFLITVCCFHISERSFMKYMVMIL